MKLLVFLIRSKQGLGFSRIHLSLVQGSDLQLSCSFPCCRGSFLPSSLPPAALGSFSPGFLESQSIPSINGLAFANRSGYAVHALPSVCLAVETLSVRGRRSCAWAPLSLPFNSRGL